MKTFRILAPIALAIGSSAAFAGGAPDQDGTLRRYTDQALYQAEPFAPQPQFWGRQSASENTRAAVKSEFDRTSFYYESAPFDPLPQFATRALPAGTPAVAASTANGETAAIRATARDPFRRPNSGYEGGDAYYTAEPFDPLPQFWSRHLRELRTGA